jgi:hypothetical protein
MEIEWDIADISCGYDWDIIGISWEYHGNVMGPGYNCITWAMMACQ